LFFKLYLINSSTKYLLVISKEYYLTDEVKDIAIIADLSLVIVEVVFPYEYVYIGNVRRGVISSKLTELISEVISGNNVAYAIYNTNTGIASTLP